MKHWKSLAAGFIIGAISMVSVTAMAGSYIQTYLMTEAGIAIDGQFVKMPADQGVLNYNSRIYVPLRFLAENMDCEVKWDAANKFAFVTTNPKVIEKEVIKEVEKVVYVESEEDTNDIVYKSLPVSHKATGYNIKIQNIVRYPTQQATKVFVNFNNIGDDVVELRARSSVLRVDGKTYKLDTFNEQDSGFMNSFRADPDDREEEYDGYINFELVPEDFSNCNLDLVVRTKAEDGSYSDKTVTFNFKVNK